MVAAFIKELMKYLTDNKKATIAQATMAF